MQKSFQDKQLGLYIHIPFCHQKCFYCSFVVAIAQDHRIDRYLECLNVEMSTLNNKKVSTIYIGGGTPGYLSLSQIETLFAGLRKYFQWERCAEITFEMNPESVAVEKVKLLKTLGVTRISLGVQTFNEKYLKYLGRNHSSQQTMEAFDVLRQGGINNVNVDLIYSLPEQTNEQLISDVDALSDLGSEHLSLYALTIEPPSCFFTRQVKLNDQDLRAQQYSLIVKQALMKGWWQYEVSNFSKEGFESQHNLHYWRGGDYFGVGVAAHSHQLGRRYWNVDNMFEYMKRLENRESVVYGEEYLSPRQRLMEVLLFGLRMNRGVDLVEMAHQYNMKLDDATQRTIEELIKEGFLFLDGNVVKATAKGQLVLDEIAVRLI